MAKKRQKRKKQKQPAPGVSLEQMAQRAQDDLENGRLRQARTGFKKLFGQDPETYRPWLIRAYETLFSQLIKDGQTNEAQTTLISLEKIDNGSKHLFEKTRLALAQGKFTQAGQSAGQWLATGTLSDTQLLCAADALVLAFEPETARNLPEKVAGDLSRIHQGLDQVSQSRLDAAMEAIKPVGLRSCFSQWKLFLKGLCAFYANADEKALQIFDRLNPDTVPARAAQAYRFLLQPADETSRATKDKIILAACTLSGHESIGQALTRADVLWRENRFSDSFRHLRSQTSMLPSRQPGIGQALTRFYFNAFSEMNEAKAEAYVDTLVQTAMKKSRNLGIEAFLTSRAIALWMERLSFSDKDILHSWQVALESGEIFGDDQPRARALVYAHLGDLFSQESAQPEMNFFFMPRKTGVVLQNGDLAEVCYLKAVEADPQRRDTRFQLLSLYEKLGEKAKANRQLDDIIKAFPDEKEALFKAGRRCLERNAPVKAMKYLGRAIELDPIDGAVRESYLAACIHSALRHVRNHRINPCRKVLELASQQASAQSSHFGRSLAFLYARWAVIEALANQQDQAAKRLDQALSIVSDAFKLNYFTTLFAEMLSVSPGWFKICRQSVEQAVAKAANIETGLVMVHTLNYFESVNPKNCPWIIDEQHALVAYLKKLDPSDLTRLQTAEIVAFLMKNDYKTARPFVKFVLADSPEDALFRWHDYQFKMLEAPGDVFRQKVVDELQVILELAQRQGEASVVKEAQTAIDSIEKLLELQDMFKPLQNDEIGFEQDEEPLDVHFPPKRRLPQKPRKAETKIPHNLPEQLNLFDEP